jgi:L-malate glycosyltransferase
MFQEGDFAGITVMIKLLHYNSARGWRGGEQQTEYLIRGLSAYSVEQFAAGKPGEEFLHRISPFVTEILPLQSKNELSPGSVMKLRRFIRQKMINIVHVHTPHAHAHAFYAHVLGTDFKLVAHRRVDFKMKNNPLSLWKYRSSHVSAVIAISKFIKNKMIGQGVPENKIRVIYSGIDTKRFSVPSKEKIALLRTQFDLPPDIPVIGNVAALTGHKDHQCLIESIARLRNKGIICKLIILGEGEERKNIEQLIRRYSLEQLVYLAGFRRDVGDFYAIFDIFVMSSRDEGLGTAVLDAMAMGVPVVATDAGGIPEILDGERYGLIVEKRKPDHLAAGIERLLDNPALREHYKKTGIGRARLFSVEDMVEKTFQVYETVIRE